MITMTDIAEKAGVSRATVSLILNGRDSTLRISENTRDKVLQVAQESGFRRNELMRSAVSGKNRMLGFLVSQSRKEAVARMLEGALGEAEAHNYTIKVLLLPEGRLQRSVLDRCVELRLAGVMVLYLEGGELSQLHDELKTYRIPLAYLDSNSEPRWGVRVGSDDHQALGLAVDHLVHLGHRRIGFVSGVPQAPMSLHREAAFAAAMRRFDLPPATIVHSHLSGAGAEAATRALLESAESPTALVGITDAMALATMRTARASGRRLPQDLSIVGYGGMALSEFADPALTTVVQPFGEIGRIAVRRLLERAHAKSDDFDDTLCKELLPAQLLLRDSTSPAA